MRVAKFLLGITCLAGSLFLAIVTSAVSAGINWTRLDHAVFYSMVATLGLFSLSLAATGIFIIAKRLVPMSNGTRTSVTVALLSSIALPVALLSHVQSHSMTSAEMVKEEMRKIHSAIQQMHTASRSNISELTPP